MKPVLLSTTSAPSPTAEQLRREVAALSEMIVRRCLKLGKTVSTAESLTGGLLSVSLTDVPGSSSVLSGAIVSYTDRIKTSVLGVREETVKNLTAVSAETAYEMAVCVREKMKTDYSISCTGLAGPGGGEPGKPVGTVYIGLSCENGTTVFYCVFPEDASREQIRLLTVRTAFEKLLEIL